MITKIKFFELTSVFYEKIHFSTENKIIRLCEEYNFFKPTDIVLDLAGGTGRVAQAFTRKVKQITVVDASPKMLEQCKEKKGIECVYGLAEEIPFPDKTFDKIILVDAFHHIQDNKKAIQELKRVLKLDGKILVEEVNPKGIFGSFLKIAEKIFMMGSTFYSPEKLKELFEAFGFTVEIIKQKNSFYSLIMKLK